VQKNEICGYWLDVNLKMNPNYEDHLMVVWWRQEVYDLGSPDWHMGPSIPARGA